MTPRRLVHSLTPLFGCDQETVNAAGQSSFGVVILDAATGAFSLSGFDDDTVKTKLETMFRQLQPKELIHEKGNLSIGTLRTLKTVLPSVCVWSSLRASEFLSAQETLGRLGDFFAGEDVSERKVEEGLPAVIEGFKDNELVLQTLGGLMSCVSPSFPPRTDPHELLLIYSPLVLASHQVLEATQSRQGSPQSEEL